MIFIDPGHGGSEIGKASNIYFLEKDKLLQISRYQYNRLISLGLDVFITRENDELLLPNARISKINKLSTANDILISNHLDINNNTGGLIVYSNRSDNKLVNILQEELKIINSKQLTNHNNLDFYYILREVIPNNSLIIFYGNTSSTDNLKNLLENWIDLSEKVIISLCKYLNKPYYKPKEKLYIIKKNDSLESISKEFNVSISSIMKNNNLSNNILFPYGILKINE